MESIEDWLASIFQCWLTHVKREALPVVHPRHSLLNIISLFTSYEFPEVCSIPLLPFLIPPTKLVFPYCSAHTPWSSDIMKMHSHHPQMWPFSSSQSCSDFNSTNFCLGVAMATRAVRQGSMAPKPRASKHPVLAWHNSHRGSKTENTHFCEGNRLRFLPLLRHLHLNLNLVLHVLLCSYGFNVFNLSFKFEYPVISWMFTLYNGIWGQGCRYTKHSLTRIEMLDRFPACHPGWLVGSCKKSLEIQ